MPPKKTSVKKVLPKKTTWPGFSPTISLVLVVVVALIVGGGLYYLSTKTKSINTNSTVGLDTNKNSNDNSNAVACTLEAKLCPNGTYVSRIPPDCQFAACPGEANINLNGNANVNSNSNINTNTDISNWQTYTNQAEKYSIQYPATWSIDKSTTAPQITPPGYTAGSMAGTARALIVEPVDTINANDIIISGPDTVYLNGLATTQQVEGGMMNYVTTYFPKADGKYIKIYWAQENQENYLEYQQIINSFQFTK